MRGRIFCITQLSNASSSVSRTGILTVDQIKYNLIAHTVTDVGICLLQYLIYTFYTFEPGTNGTSQFKTLPTVSAEDQVLTAFVG